MGRGNIRSIGELGQHTLRIDGEAAAENEQTSRQAEAKITRRAIRVEVPLTCASQESVDVRVAHVVAAIASASVRSLGSSRRPARASHCESSHRAEVTLSRIPSEDQSRLLMGEAVARRVRSVAYLQG